MSQKFKTFKEFWPEYLRLHSKPITRAVHYAGTLGGIALATTGAIVGAPLLIAAAPVFTYGLLFASHPVFEKNRPATFKNPVMSVGGDIKMLFCFLTGRVDSEFKKYGLDPTGRSGNNQNDPNAVRPAVIERAGRRFSPASKASSARHSRAWSRPRTTMRRQSPSKGPRRRRPN